MSKYLVVFHGGAETELKNGKMEQDRLDRAADNKLCFRSLLYSLHRFDDSSY